MEGDRKITMLVNQDGSVQLEVDGVKGSSCTDLTKEVEDALGNVTSRKKKAEYHAISKTETKQQVRGG
jgi:hypothetical protein